MTKVDEIKDQHLHTPKPDLVLPPRPSAKPPSSSSSRTMSRSAEQTSPPVIKMQPKYDSVEQLPLSKEPLPTLPSFQNLPKESKKQYTIRFLFTMLLSIIFTCLVGTYALRTHTSGPALRTSEPVVEYVAKEGPVALQGLFANIGTHGSKSSGAHEGVVIASPSTSTFRYSA